MREIKFFEILTFSLLRTVVLATAGMDRAMQPAPIVVDTIDAAACRDLIFPRDGTTPLRGRRRADRRRAGD